MDIRPKAQSAAAQSTKGSPMDRIAEQYVKLVLALGQHDADYVDAYYGPPEWKKEAAVVKIDLDAIGARAKALIADIDRERKAIGPSKPGRNDEMMPLRVPIPRAAAVGAQARVRMLKGERLSFDDESRALYDAVAPTFPESHFQEILDRLEKRFPGLRTPGRTVRRISTLVRHPARQTRSGISARYSGGPRTNAAARHAAGRMRNSPSSTSPTNRGAATTGIKAAIAV